MVTVMALNYLHSGGSFPSHASLRRPPNAAQAKAFSYIERLVRACGATEGIDVPTASRRSSELIARLTSALQFLPSLDTEAKRKVFQALDVFPLLVSTTAYLASLQIPEKAWYNLLAAGMRA